MFKRLIAKLATRAAGLPDVNENAERNLAIFFEQNGITVPSLTCYKKDRIKERSFLFERVYVGKAKHNGKLVGLVIKLDEDDGFVYGKIFSPEKIHLHVLVANNYIPKDVAYNNLYSEICDELGKPLYTLTSSGSEKI